MRVVATTTQAGDFARAIGGDRVDVVQMLRPGIDPHDFEPGPADLVALYTARVLVSNGAGLESWLDDTISAASFHGIRVVMADGVPLRHEVGAKGEADPHIWQDPRNAMIMVADIARGLTRADPAGRSYYQANLAGYTAELTRLDRADAAKISTIPANQRKLVTNHDAFGYYTARYGLTFVGSIVPSFDTSAELSAHDISTLVSKVRKEHVAAIFSESSLPSKIAKTIGEQAGVTVISGAGSLYADSLGPAGTPGATYIGAESHNTDVIVGALQ
jgi:zinc/manganese transport system substrate-binding protein/manganese/iron transport system substrate-binding protein